MHAQHCSDVLQSFPWANPTLGHNSHCWTRPKPSAESRLPQLYAYPDDLTRCWVRSNFISSLDGGATSDGKSGGLAGPGDKALFGLMRELADVIVVGAGTARVNYGGAQCRQRPGRPAGSGASPRCPDPPSSPHPGLLDRDMKVFTQTEVPPLVLTAAAALPATRERLGPAAEVLSCSGTDTAAVDITSVLAVLAGRGLLRVLTEGGPSLHATFIEADLLDELCVTLAPVLVGGRARRIATGAGQVQTEMRRAHLLADEAGYLYTRYVPR